MAETPMTRESSTSSSLSDVDIDASTTPPTSQADTGEMSISSATKPAALLEAIEESLERRPRRSRAGGPSSYNLKQLSDAQLPISTASASRNVSGLTGRTLVGGEAEEDVKTIGKGEDEEEGEPELPPRPLQRKTSVRDRVKKAAGRVVGSVLGKRGRDVVEAGKRKLGRGKSQVTAEDEDEDEASDTEPQEEVPRWKKALEMGPKGLLDELDLDIDLPAPPPAKKAKLSGKEAMKDSPQPSAPLAKAATATKSMKPWIREGLYVGQSPDFDPTQPGGKRKLTKKRPSSSSSFTTTTTLPGAAESSGSKRTFLPLPMFGYLKEEKTRDFRIPYDVFAPSLRKGDERPKDWHQVNRNRLVGEAKQIWEKSERLPASRCVCRTPSADGEMACGDHCLNRVMQYECNDDNCAVKGGECGNRCFADLTSRLKKGGAFDVGVEVLKTDRRGFGVRSCRTWGPGEIIMEYTGEIVSEGECQRRMHEDYKDKQCYYLMELERGLIIDGTKGSMARFINHSCEPNCEVRMVKVNGTPRMGVFAGERGVATGQELTYDYNFDNFGEKLQNCYCGAASCRGTLSKRLNKDEQKKQLKVENERKRKAAEEAQKAAEDEDRRKRVKSDRGSGWRGWASVDDPEVKAKLKREKAEREEAAKSSDRARRLAARGSGAQGAEREPVVRKKVEAKRRRTVAVEETVTRATLQGRGDEGDEVDVEAGAAEAVAPAAASSRPVSAATVTTRKTEITISETAEPEPVADRFVTALDGVHDDEEQEEEEEEEVVVVAPAKTKKQSIMKSVEQAVMNGLFGAVGAKALGGSGGKGGLKQSQTSFHQISTGSFHGTFVRILDLDFNNERTTNQLASTPAIRGFIIATSAVRATVKYRVRSQDNLLLYAYDPALNFCLDHSQAGWDCSTSSLLGLLPRALLITALRIWSLTTVMDLISSADARVYQLHQQLNAAKLHLGAVKSQLKAAERSAEAARESYAAGMRCHLLELPPELRVRIYEYLYEGYDGYDGVGFAVYANGEMRRKYPWQVPGIESTPKRLHNPTSLLKVCRVITTQATPILYQMMTVTVHFLALKDIKSAPMLSPAARDLFFRQVKNMNLHVSAFGPEGIERAIIHMPMVLPTQRSKIINEVRLDVPYAPRTGCTAWMYRVLMELSYDKQARVDCVGPKSAQVIKDFEERTGVMPVFRTQRLGIAGYDGYYHP
ncbi:hypothetical protein LTR15_008991 [Elasticomyces elasticus]|nr:hypothetical protein LTR15_008991 [Elasticomyces elasticus]